MTNNQLEEIISPKEISEIKKKMIAVSDFQRLSSLLLWIGIAMIILHLSVDIFFHII